MKNADKFKGIFGIYASELWAKTEKEFLEWLNEYVPDTNVGDMISRQAAIDAVNSHMYVYENKYLNDYEQGWNDACDYCADEWLDDLPSAQDEKKGEAMNEIVIFV